MPGRRSETRRAARRRRGNAHRSPRANRQFLAVNCAAMPEGLLQSELFGHRKGTFTGAMSDRDGLFRQADGGTLLLDEIAQMSPALQASLLRCLQESEVMPVGGRSPIKFDVRGVVATNRDLKQAVADGKFREACTRCCASTTSIRARSSKATMNATP